MPFRTNPFVDRMSERTSDYEFIRLFSPRVFERLDEGVLSPAVHLFRSAPGAGKTTLLRALTPASLRGFWRARNTPDLADASRYLERLGALHSTDGPALLGVLLSCASGYADLPPSSPTDGHLFRALFDCRVVLRTLLSLGAFVSESDDVNLEDIQLAYPTGREFGDRIPQLTRATELLDWAQQQERRVLANLDDLGGRSSLDGIGHPRFESILWLQHVEFTYRSTHVAPRRLLMIDDLQTLARSQRKMFLDEILVMRPQLPIWLATRNMIFGESLLSQGARQGREVHEYPLEELWGAGKNNSSFSVFAQNVLDRRMQLQDDVPGATFRQCLREDFTPGEINSFTNTCLQMFNGFKERHGAPKYEEWFARAEKALNERTVEGLIDVLVTCILVARDSSKRQLSFDITLSVDDLDERGGPQVRGAAEIFLNHQVGVPYYFGWDRICTMATSNIEELLSMAAAIFDAIHAKVILRKDFELAPHEQEKHLRSVAKRRLEFIPRSQLHGSRALRLLRSIGTFCRERTFRPNAPIAPGVTGIRLTESDMSRLQSQTHLLSKDARLLLPVLAECAAENLLVVRPSQASSSRPAGTIFYLNRCLCAHFGLPTQMGGWQDVGLEVLADWMTGTPATSLLPRYEDA